MCERVCETERAHVWESKRHLGNKIHFSPVPDLQLPSCLTHRSIAFNDSHLRTGVCAPFCSSHIARTPFLPAPIRQHIRRRGIVIHDKFWSYLNTPHLSAKSAKQGLLLSTVAEGFCLAGSVASALRTRPQSAATQMLGSSRWLMSGGLTSALVGWMLTGNLEVTDAISRSCPQHHPAA